MDSDLPPPVVIEESTWAHTSDITDEDMANAVAFCHRMGCKPLDMLGCWMSESGFRSNAHNPGGNATGFFQAMPSTLAWLGFEGHWDDFQKLSISEQLVWAEKYYAPHRGRLVSAGACYLATFLPALMSHASEPSFVLCASQGPFQAAYHGNYRAFDPSGKGYITVQDLTDRIHRVMFGARWEEIAKRAEIAECQADTEPVISADNPPLFILPDLDG